MSNHFIKNHTDLISSIYSLIERPSSRSRIVVVPTHYAGLGCFCWSHYRDAPRRVQRHRSKNIRGYWRQRADEKLGDRVPVCIQSQWYMLYPVSERASHNEQRHGRATLSAQVRRTCVQHRSPESVEQYSCWSARHTEHCYVQKEPENIFIPWILFVVLT